MADPKKPEGEGPTRQSPAPQPFVARTQEYVRPSEPTLVAPAPLVPAAPAAAGATGTGRRRFGDGEGTVIMPLAEILRARHAQTAASAAAAPAAAPPDGHRPPAEGAQDVRPPPAARGPGEAGGFGSQATVIMRRPQLPSRPAAATVPKPAGTPQAPQGATSPGRAELTQPAHSLDLRPPLQDRGPAAPAGPETPVARPPPPGGAATPTAPAASPPASLEVAGSAEPACVLPPTVPTGRFGNLVIFSCKGGAGATFLALNIAHFAATQKRAACLIDLDLQFGDDLAALGLSPAMTVSGALGELAKKQPVTSDKLARHGSGLCVLSQAGSLEDLDQVRSEALPLLVENLRSGFDVIVYDGVRDFSDNTLAVLDLADKIALVVVQEVLAVRRARAAFGILRKIGFDPADIVVVVNRASSHNELPLSTLASLFAPATVLPVPDERGLAVQSLNQAVPMLLLQPAHPLTRAIGRVAATMLGMPVEAEPAAAAGSSGSSGGEAGKGFWGRLGPKGTK